MVKFNVKLLRLKNDNMSQKELISKTNIRPSTLSAIENNVALTISIEQINKLCKALNCTTGELIEYIPDNNN